MDGQEQASGGVLSALSNVSVEVALPSAQPTFAARIIAWQRREGRHDLPWQQTRDPYRIWLSEIMLQQTQVKTVIPYYQRFLAHFPIVTDLAAAMPEAVAELWAGLGYYSRARNLHRCAQAIASGHGGHFPATPEALAALPGIGRSTAAAIAAFAWGQRAAILDGNVKRVLCRHFGIEGFPGQTAVDRQLWALAETLLPEVGIEAYTQGLMDLGSSLCARSRPACERCPLAATCVAHATGRQRELPARRPRPALPERTATFLLVRNDGAVLVERRPPAGIWGGLLVPPEGDPSALLANLGLAQADCEDLPEIVHTFTHFRLNIRPLLCHVARPLTLGETGLSWLPLAEVDKAALPTPFRRLLAQIPCRLPQE